MMSELKQNPYVGPRTFRTNESDLFFGRDREALDLLSLVISERLVLFYAQSGAGKSSLVNTKLIPGLIAEEEYEILPVGRVSGAETYLARDVENIYIYNLISSLLQQEIHPDVLAKLSLTDFLSGLETSRNGDLKKVLIIDQFEELFSTHQEVWEKRKDFFTQLTRAMRNLPRLWVVLVMREDYIASLDPYVHLLPGKIRVRYYMQRLERDAAIQAIKGPVKNLCPYAEGVAERLAKDLSSINIQQADGTTVSQPGQFVESVQLQVVCSSLWEKLPIACVQITQEQVDRFVGDVNQALGKYYEERVRFVAEGEEAKKRGIQEREIREWFGKKLITADGLRNLIAQERGRKSGGLDDSVVQEFVKRGDLVRAEKRGGSTFYELTHDRLVEPILENNRIWINQNTNLLQRGTVLWEEQDHSAGLLLRGKELYEAEAWAKIHNNQLSQNEKNYLEACQKARNDAQDRARINQRIRKTLVVSIIVSLVAVVFMMLAIMFGIQAYENYLQTVAENLTYQANNLQNTDTEDKELIETLLLYQALKNYPYTSMAERALSTIVSPSKKISSFTVPPGTFFDMFITQDNSTITTINQGGSIQSWNSNTGQLVSTVKINGPISLAVFNIDGSKVLTSSQDNLTHLWDTKNGKDLGVYEEYAGTASFSKDGTRIATSAHVDKKIRIWDVKTRKLIKSLPAASFTNSEGKNYYPDGSRILDFDEYGVPGIWDTNTGERISSLKVRNTYVHTVTFSPDGFKVAGVSADYQIILWDSNGNLIWKASVVPSGIEKIIDNQKIFNNDYQANNTASIFITEPFFSPNGSKIVAAVTGNGPIGSNNIYVWDVNTGKKIFTLSGNTSSIKKATFASDGSLLATSGEDHVIRFWDIQNLNNQWRTNNRSAILQISRGSFDSDIENIVFSSDDTHFLIAWTDGRVEFWQIAPNQAKLLSLAEGSCGICEFNYRQRLEYEVYDLSMIIYAYRNYVLAFWIGIFYIILFGVTYKSVFSNRNDFLVTPDHGFTYKRFFSAGLIGGTVLCIFITGFIAIAISEQIGHYDEEFSTVRTFDISLLLYLASLPILIWPGCIYTHKTRSQIFGRHTIVKRVLISAAAGFAGFLVVSIFLLLIPIILSSSALLFVIVFALLISIILGFPTNITGSLVYIYGLHPLAIRWYKKIVEDEY